MTDELTTEELLDTINHEIEDMEFQLKMYLAKNDEYCANSVRRKLQARYQLRKLIEEHIALKGELADLRLTEAGLKIARGEKLIEQQEEGEVVDEEIKRIIDYPPKGHSRRGKDGYPLEVTYDEFAYKRMVDFFRDSLKQLLSRPQKGTVTIKEIHDFVDKEWQDCEYGYPESYEVKGMIIDFLRAKFGEEVVE